MAITVINKRSYLGKYIYCGRGSILGNRYSHLDYSKADFKVSTREEAVELGIQDIYNRLIDGETKLVQAVVSLLIKYKKGEDIVLGCYCHPLLCHLDLIKQGIENDEFISIPHVEKLFNKMWS